MRSCDWKRGSGTLMICLSFCLVGVLCAGLVTLKASIFHNTLYAQTRADVVSDGVAEYGRTVFGSIDQSKADQMTAYLVTANSLDSDDYFAEIDKSKYSEGDIEVTVHGTAGNGFFSLNKDFTRSALTHVLATEIVATSEMVPDNYLHPCSPVLTNGEGDRSPEAYYNVAKQFNVSRMSRYRPKVWGGSTVTFCNIYARDVMSAMGLSGPYAGSSGGCGVWFHNLYTGTQSGGQPDGWRRLSSAAEAQQYADQGWPTIALWTEHVQVVMPSPSALGAGTSDPTKIYISETGGWSNIHDYYGEGRHKYVDGWYHSTADPFPQYNGWSPMFFTHP